MTTAIRTIGSTYGYHPADATPDLLLLTSVVEHYSVADMSHLRRIDSALEWDIRQNGITAPLAIYTNGSLAMIGDGNHRLRIARKLGIDKLPVQILPDNLRRKASTQGYPSVEPVLAEWIADNLWSHNEHTVTRLMKARQASSGGIAPNPYTQCNCSCGARWRELA